MASQSLPPASPTAVLRGHQAQVHATAFVRGNQRLASGDADGYVVLWDLTIMRPRAVWRAHANAILGIASWGRDKIITHGRDNQLIVWKVAEEDEDRLSTVLPLDPAPDSRPQPWVLHILGVNTMNFCSFASCPANADGSGEELLVAVPNTLASESVDIYKLPSQERLHTVHSPNKADQSGMVMALAIFYVDSSLTVIAAYENGLAIVLQQSEQGGWDLLYTAQTHSQPVLSLDVAQNKKYFLTSGADAIVAKHPIPARSSSTATAGSDIKPVAITNHPRPPGNGRSLLSAALAADPQPKIMAAATSPIIVQTQPLRTINTKHSGQQSLRIRSDGKIYATAGWDSKVRVYSSHTMKELAVLKWHQVGCYAVAFANLRSIEDGRQEPSVEAAEDGDSKDPSNADSTVVVPRLVDVTVRERRIKQARETHWLAAGSKDGKISLWDIY
ncbi:WD40-repeat-containing domain protein [Xylariales sp. PMI_506]|nr:WD40-repeat-containing domain protein [Xylariales sp. PMI_506]